jgi:hypothetical protein
MNISEEQSTKALDLYAGQHSILTLIVGESGRGKTTSIRTLPPESTYLINVMGKSLPFPGRGYSTDKNMLSTTNPAMIREKMKKVSEDPTIENLIVDDLHYVMATEFMDKAMQKGYEKFTIMARNMWDILVMGSQLRPGLKVFFTCHEEEVSNGVRRMKTLGKLLAEKLTPEGLATIVLWSEVIVPANSQPNYYFSTQTDGTTNAKSPVDMFPPRIPNDLHIVSQRIDEYYTGISLKDSKILK